MVILPRSRIMYKEMKLLTNPHITKHWRSSHIVIQIKQIASVCLLKGSNYSLTSHTSCKSLSQQHIYKSFPEKLYGRYLRRFEAYEMPDLTKRYSTGKWDMSAILFSKLKNILLCF